MSNDRTVSAAWSLLLAFSAVIATGVCLTVSERSWPHANPAAVSRDASKPTEIATDIETATINVHTAVQACHVGQLGGFEFTSDGRFLITRSIVGEVILWDAENGSKIRNLIPAGLPHEYWSDIVAVRQFYGLVPGTSRVLSGSRTEDAAWLELQTLPESVSQHRREPPVRFELAEAVLPHFAQLTNDRRYLVAQSQSGFHVWDVQSRRRIRDASHKLARSVELAASARKRLYRDPWWLGNAVNAVTRLAVYDHVRPDGLPLRWPRVLHIASEGTSNEFTPNGKHFVTREWSDTGSSDEEVVLWDAAKHIPLKKTSRPYVERRHFEFTSDGRFYLERGDSPHDINLRDIATTELVHKFSHAAEVTARALSPDDSTCLAATKGGWIHLWDLRSGRKLMAVDVGLVHVLSLDYRPDARQCLLGTKDGIAVTLDLPSGATGVRFENTETGEPTSGHAKFSPDGSRVVIESAGNEFHQASLWNAVTGERLQLLASPPSHNIWLSPNGRWALCVPWHTVPIRQRSRRIEHWAMLQTVPNRIELRDTSTGNVAHVFKGFGRYWHDNGSPSKVPREYRITWPRSKHDLGIVEPLMPQTSESFKTAIFLDAVFEFSPSQREVIRRIEGLDDVAREWLLGMISSEIVSDQSEVQRIRLKQKRLDGSYADRPVSGLSSAPVAVVENSERVLREFTDDAVSTVGPANAVWSVTATAVNGEGTRVVIAYRNDRQTATKRLVTWDVESGRRLKEIAVTEKDLDRGWDIKSLAFSPDGRYLAIGFNYDTYLMDLTNNQRFHVADIRDSLSANVEFVSFSPDGRRVVCADEQRSLWDIPNRKKLAELKIDDSRPNPIFSPNGKFVAMLSNRAFHFWDAETGEKQLLDQQGYHAGLFQFSPDGKRFLGAKSAGKDHEYRVRLTLWDFQNGKELAALYNAADPREIVRGAVFTPDGERLVTTYPNRLAVWDVTTGKQISSHTNPRREFEFQGNQQSPVFIDDRTLITVHHTGATRWDLDTGQPIVDYPTPRSRRTSVRLGSGDRRLLTVSPGRHAALWDIKSGRKLLTYADVPADLDFQFDAIRLSSDNRELFVVHRQGEAITVWDAESGRMTKRHFLLDRGREWVNEHHEK